MIRLPFLFWDFLRIFKPQFISKQLCNYAKSLRFSPDVGLVISGLSGCKLAGFCPGVSGGGQRQRADCPEVVGYGGPTEPQQAKLINGMIGETSKGDGYSNIYIYRFT